MSGFKRNQLLRARVAMGAILLWAVLILAFMSWLMSGHLAPLPPPAVVDSAGISRLTAGDGPSGSSWRMVHVLVSGCPCSRYTAQTLAARKPAPACHETVVILGDTPDWEPILAQAGFAVCHKTGPELLKETGLAGGPWLLIVSPSGEMVYSGGYAMERPRPGVALQDLNLFQAAVARQRLSYYPAFGCAAAPLRQGLFNPVTVCQSIQ